MRFVRIVRRKYRLLLVLVLVVACGTYYGGWKTDRLVSRAEKFLADGDHNGAVLMARSAFARDSDDEAVKEILMQAYEARRDPRVLALLSGDQLATTLKAIDLGVERRALDSYSKLMQGHTVDVLSYHEMGLHLFRNDPQIFLEHAEALADLTPKDPETLLRLAYGSLRAGANYPESHRVGLVNAAVNETGSLSADASAIALTLMLTFPSEKAWPRSPIELTGWLQIHIESAVTVRSSFLRALEASRAARSDSERAVTSSLLRLCCELKSGSETRKVAEGLTRIGRGEVLIRWYQEHPEAFPKVEPQEPQNAFARLLIADAAAAGNRWDLVEDVIGEEPFSQWGELRFLRHFYEGRMMRERNLWDRSLLDRERQLLARASMADAKRCATKPWQQAVLAGLAEKYVLDQRR